MKNSIQTPSLNSVLGVLLVVVLGALVIASQRPSIGNDDQPVELEPVEEDMHEFMEYAFEPQYKRLREVMAAAPEANSQWKSIKGDALSLAEGGNLLLMRVPDEGESLWKKFSAGVRRDGSSLYRAARSKDYEAAKKSYAAMLNQCNRCHQEFAGGKHQLKP